jgi:hypothetical protein
MEKMTKNQIESEDLELFCLFFEEEDLFLKSSFGLHTKIAFWKAPH